MKRRLSVWAMILLVPFALYALGSIYFSHIPLFSALGETPAIFLLGLVSAVIGVLVAPRTHPLAK